jgi:fructose-1,6-bisphosphatase/sedoheptulose 1,7-bisphosphatase-like protein
MVQNTKQQHQTVLAVGQREISVKVPDMYPDRRTKNAFQRSHAAHRVEVGDGIVDYIHTIAKRFEKE